MNRSSYRGHSIRSIFSSSSALLLFLSALLLLLTVGAATTTTTTATATTKSGPKAFTAATITAGARPHSLAGWFRGGSTIAAVAPGDDDDAEAAAKKTKEDEELRKYRVQQQLYLQSRGTILRQALIDRGLEGLDHTPAGADGGAESQPKKPVDWECAAATERNPKSCLYSFDAETGAKVVAPRTRADDDDDEEAGNIGNDEEDNHQWITLAALNRLRRQDPTKVEPLWHGKYDILSTWLNPNSEYSMYTHLAPPQAALSYLLDAPKVLGASMLLAAGLVVVIFWPVIDFLLQQLLVSHWLWWSWEKWYRYARAALPLKLLIGQMAATALSKACGRLYQRARDYLIEIECQMWEQAIPLTIVDEEELEARARREQEKIEEQERLQQQLMSNSFDQEEEEDFSDSDGVELEGEVDLLVDDFGELDGVEDSSDEDSLDQL